MTLIKQINYSHGCIRVHAQIDQGHAVCMAALMCLYEHPSVGVCKGKSSLLTLCWIWC